MRFFAAFFIVVYHAGANAPGELAGWGPLFQRGYLATDFFLILSGYVLGRAYGQRLASGDLTVRQFLGRRLIRLWPAHLVVMVSFAILIGGSEWMGRGPNQPYWYLWRDWPVQAALAQAWGGHAGGGWNLPSWSLSALMICYILFPVMWLAQSQVRSAALVAFVAFAGVAAAAQAAPILVHQGFYDLPFNYGLFRAAPLFALGAALARLTKDRPLGQIAGRLLLAGGVIVVIGLQYLGRFDLVSMAALSAVILGAGSLTGAGSRLAATGARLSFALFITHAFAFALWFGALHALAHGVSGEGRGWLVWSAGLAFAVTLAAAFDRFIDQPLQAWLKGVGRRPAAPVPVRSAALDAGAGLS